MHGQPRSAQPSGNVVIVGAVLSTTVQQYQLEPRVRGARGPDPVVDTPAVPIEERHCSSVIESPFSCAPTRPLPDGGTCGFLDAGDQLVGNDVDLDTTGIRIEDDPLRIAGHRAVFEDAVPDLGIEGLGIAVPIE